MQRLCETIILVDSGSLLRYTLTRSVRLLADTFHTIYWRSHELLANGVKRGITTCSTGVKVVVVVFCFDKNGPPPTKSVLGTIFVKTVVVVIVYLCVYRLLAGAPSSLKKTILLDKGPKNGFLYLNPLSLKSAGIDDTADFKSLVQSMKSVRA